MSFCALQLTPHLETKARHLSIGGGGGGKWQRRERSRGGSSDAGSHLPPWFLPKRPQKLPLLSPGGDFSCLLKPAALLPRPRKKKKGSPGRGKGKKVGFFSALLQPKEAGSFRAAVASLTSEQKQTSVCFNNHLSIKRSNHKRRLFARTNPRLSPFWRPPSVKGHLLVGTSAASLEKEALTLPTSPSLVAISGQAWLTP